MGAAFPIACSTKALTIVGAGSPITCSSSASLLAAAGLRVQLVRRVERCCLIVSGSAAVISLLIVEDVFFPSRSLAAVGMVMVMVMVVFIGMGMGGVGLGIGMVCQVPSHVSGSTSGHVPSLVSVIGLVWDYDQVSSRVCGEGEGHDGVDDIGVLSLFTICDYNIESLKNLKIFGWK